jgi:protein involved in polysaccharide export with SLBB domain
MHMPTAEQRWSGLVRFGFDLFNETGALAPVEGGPVGPDYVLGPGDQLQVFVSSFVDTTYALTLDRDGKASCRASVRRSCGGWDSRMRIG